VRATRCFKKSRKKLLLKKQRLNKIVCSYACPLLEGFPAFRSLPSGRPQVSLCSTHRNFKKQLYPLPYTLIFLAAEDWQLFLNDMVFNLLVLDKVKI